MVEAGPDDGKNPDMNPAWLPVVAAALQRADGLWLMHQRPLGKHHGGLWEFPGGKVEANEIPVESLIRELEEELGIRCDPDACSPCTFAESGSAKAAQAIVILLYTVKRWKGDPISREGGQIGWFTPQAACALPMPPLDVRLAAHLFQNR